MRRDLGASGAAASAVPATRVHRPGWRDLRMWVGVAIVAGCVLLGARLMAAADDTVAVWSAAGNLGAGAPVGESDLRLTRVRLDAATQAGYFTVDEALPAAAVLTRGVAAGELLPRAAVADGSDQGLVQLPIAVDPSQMPPAVGTGSVIDVYAVGHKAVPALSGVTVLSVSADTSGFGGTSTRQLVVVVPAEAVQPFLALLAGDQPPVISVVRRN